MDCERLIHPFQNDPGTSQSQRVMDNLLSDAAKIDARTLADLLNYFVQMSRHINYYDLQLNVNDWQPFFKNSVPFTLASIIKFPLKNAGTNFILYKHIFDKKPSPAGLQLIAFSIYYRFIYNINNWHLILKDSSLPIAATLEGLINNKLKAPVKQFIQYSNAAIKTYGISRIDFLKLSNNPVWGLDSSSLSAIDTSFSAGTISDRQRMINLYTDFNTLLTVFSDAIKTLSAASENNLEGSFIPLKEELQKKHQPHLALLFAFLNMFRQLQNDLNQYTRKHLDYFYKEMLQFKPAEAIPDKANIVFEIQKALKNYLIKKGLRVKDGKDDNKQEILFSLDDDIVVNKTTIADKRTLFLNNQRAHSQTYVEGVYMAPVAEMADGVEKEFSDDPANFPTLGAHYSKYIDPETKLVKPYPNARLGFILASPVLFLQEGSTRTVDIALPCELNKSICADIETSGGNSSNDCCDDKGTTVSTSDTVQYPDFYQSGKFYDEVNKVLSATYYYINEDIIKEAQKKGISAKLADELRESFIMDPEETLCYCPVRKRKFEATIVEADFNTAIAGFTTGEKQILKDLIKPRRAFSFLFSGEKEWIEPSTIDKLELFPPSLPMIGPLANQFTLNIKLTLNPGKGTVSSYNKDNLLEDFGTTDPLVKIQLDDKIKFSGISLEDIAEPSVNNEDCCIQDKNCCLLKEDANGDVSLYHFFRNVIIRKADNSIKDKAVITVNVCGLKNFIVQNDESVMDVNGPVYPFGSRPEILNFDMNNPPKPADDPLIGPAFYIGSEEIFFKKWDFVRINLKWKDKPDDFGDYYGAYIKNGLIASSFELKVSALVNGKWLPVGEIESLFANSSFWTTPPAVVPTVPSCISGFDPDQKYLVFSHAVGIDTGFIKDQHLNKKLEAATLNGFLKLNLVNQDFLHKNYSFVLARQMMALGRLPKELLTYAVYKDHSNNTVFVFSDAFGIIDTLGQHVVQTKVSSDITEIKTQQNIVNADVGNVNPAHPEALDTKTKATAANDDLANLIAVNSLFSFFQSVNRDKLEALIPNEPWTPVISNISLDYSAIATIQDINLIHLYPYDGTCKKEALNLQPTLFPAFCDEGSLFLGLKDLVPGENLNILFQLAEATSDSESDKETVYWQYLDSNIWKPLRTGFEVLDDATKNLTSSGIIKLALPANMTSDNTVMPKGLHWIKASIPQNSGSVSETIGIFSQAIKVIFTGDAANDKLRLSKPLLSGSISKLEVADASVKAVSQPFDSFGGLVPEIEQQFYVRVSETLRHKGRAIQAFDYERLALQAFPQLFKVKCINHSFALNAHEYKNDFPYAGGYILLAVIPDLNQLKAGNSFEPKVPVSILEDINAFIRQRTSPFVRFRVMNPRYEKINICLRIRLLKGKDENYYKEKVREDIREFLAPWAVGDYYKLTFGQCVYRSDIIQFLETRDYMDFISDLRMAREGDTPTGDQPKICPDTPRSILIAGDIEVCINGPDCESWGDYYVCPDDKNPIVTCETKPKNISDYCK